MFTVIWSKAGWPGQAERLGWSGGGGANTSNHASRSLSSHAIHTHPFSNHHPPRGTSHPTNRSRTSLDLPPGQKIIDGIVDLLSVPDDNGRDQERKLRAALKDIALEKEELDILKHVGWKPPPASSDSFQGLPEVPEDYLPPSRLAKKASHFQSQTSLQERELQLLKTASHSLSQSIKSIHAQLSSTQTEIRELEDNLGELSIKADTTLSQTHRTSQSLLSISPPQDFNSRNLNDPPLRSHHASTKHALILHTHLRRSRRASNRDIPS
ncbi:hypothetical protein BDQ17DRAFT_1420039 [Cyathus striatus]|nr:hypothetical protein BDQ17DRAFT_1420039 [Cyathus striatus]